MNNNNVHYCTRCGFQNKMENSFCSNCGQALTNNSANFMGNTQMMNSVNNQEPMPINNQVVDTTNAQPINNENKTGTTLGIIALVLWLFGSTLFEAITAFAPESIRSFISSLGGISSLAGIIVMIIGRIKYPNNKFLKTVMWIMIVLTVGAIIVMIVLFLWCMVTCSSQDWSNFG